MNKKLTGSYYTPKPIADFMVRYIFGQIDDENISILEPSVGNGVFIKSIAETSFTSKSKNSLTLVEINNNELLEAQKEIKRNKCNIIIHNGDFLKYLHDSSEKFTLIIGNPPYIQKKLLSKETINLCEKVHKSSNMSKNKINNIWTSFVVGSINLLKDNGILAFVLPSDILQVKYAEEIREHLENKFERIEIYTLETSDFPDIEQQTIILIAYKNKKINGTYFYKIKSITEGITKQISSNGLMISQKKWTHYNLSFSDIKLLNKITKDMPKVSDFVKISAGIVTGANNFFIQTKSIIDKYELGEYALPILSKSSLFKRGVELSTNEFNSLGDKSYATHLIAISENDKLNSKQLEYIFKGEELGLNKRYKCSLRKKWYSVPNISTHPKAIYFKRCHTYPKLIENSAKVFVTDTAYKIYPKKDMNTKSFIFSFYNIVTLIYAELMGRKYGGGVLELTPNELKDLPIIYTDIKNAEYKQFVKKINANNNILETIEFVNNKTRLVNHNELNQLQNIYKKLTYSRIGKAPRENTIHKTSYKQ